MNRSYKLIKRGNNVKPVPEISKSRACVVGASFLAASLAFASPVIGDATSQDLEVSPVPYEIALDPNPKVDQAMKRISELLVELDDPYLTEKDFSSTLDEIKKLRAQIRAEKNIVDDTLSSAGVVADSSATANALYQTRGVGANITQTGSTNSVATGGTISQTNTVESVAIGDKIDQSDTKKSSAIGLSILQRNNENGNAIGNDIHQTGGIDSIAIGTGISDYNSADKKGNVVIGANLNTNNSSDNILIGKNVRAKQNSTNSIFIAKQSKNFSPNFAYNGKDSSVIGVDNTGDLNTDTINTVYGNKNNFQNTKNDKIKTMTIGSSNSVIASNTVVGYNNIVEKDLGNLIVGDNNVINGSLAQIQQARTLANSEMGLKSSAQQGANSTPNNANLNDPNQPNFDPWWPIWFDNVKEGDKSVTGEGKPGSVVEVDTPDGKLSVSTTPKYALRTNQNDPTGGEDFRGRATDESALNVSSHNIFGKHNTITTDRHERPQININIVGNKNMVSQARNINVLGDNIYANVENSVYLGNTASATKSDNEKKPTLHVSNRNYYPQGWHRFTSTGGDQATIKETVIGGMVFEGYAGEKSNGVVTVGSVSENYNIKSNDPKFIHNKLAGEKRIQHVAAGYVDSLSTDAVNGSQLYATQKAIAGLDKKVDNITQVFKYVDKTDSSKKELIKGANGKFYYKEKIKFNDPRFREAVYYNGEYYNKEFLDIDGGLVKVKDKYYSLKDMGFTKDTQDYQTLAELYVLNNSIDSIEKTKADLIANTKIANVADENVIGQTNSVLNHKLLIRGVADAIEDSDAVNLGQLKSLTPNYDNAMTYRVQNRETKTGYTDLVSILNDMNQQGLRGLHVNNERPNALDSSAGGSDSIAIGVGATVGKVGKGVEKNDPKYANSIALGSSNVEAKTSYAVGTRNQITSNSATAIGNNNIVGYSISSRNNANEPGFPTVSGDVVSENSHALGNNNELIGENSIVAGNRNRFYAQNSSAIGNDNQIKQYHNNSGQSIDSSNVNIVGNKNFFSGSKVFVAGTENFGTDIENSVVLGNKNLISQNGSSVIGNSNLASANSNIMGNNNDTSSNAVAIGQNNKINGEKSITIGEDNIVGSKLSGIIGHNSQIIASESVHNPYNTSSRSSGIRTRGVSMPDPLNARNSYIIGNESKTESVNTFILGNNAEISTDMHNAVVLGSGSSAKVEYGANNEKSGTYYKQTKSSQVLDDNDNVLMTFDGYAGANNNSEGYVVSIGSIGKERQLKHVAAGEVTETSTDGINGSQLYATNKKLANLGNSVKNSIGGKTIINNDGKIITKNVGGMGVDTIDEAIALAAKKGDGDQATHHFVDNQGNRLYLGLNGKYYKTPIGKLEYDSGTKEYKLNNVVVQDEKLSHVASASKNDVRFSNVADATENNDAVNLGQFKDAMGASPLKWSNGTAERIVLGENGKFYAGSLKDKVLINGEYYNKNDVKNGNLKPGAQKVADIDKKTVTMINKNGSNFRLENIDTPINDYDAVNKKYVDDSINGLNFNYGLEADDGSAATTTTGNNIKVLGKNNIETSVENGSLMVGLKKDIDLTKDGSLKFGNNGIKINSKTNRNEIVGLGNTKWDITNAKDDRGATEGQLKDIVNGLGKYDNKVTEGKNITVTETKGAQGERVFNVATKDNMNFTDKGSIEFGDSGIKINAEKNKNEIIGLGNTKWDVNNIKEDRASTEGQLKDIVDGLGKYDNKVKAGTNITVTETKGAQGERVFEVATKDNMKFTDKGSVEFGDNGIKINAEKNKNEIIGLGNTKWDINNIKEDRASTEGQLKDIVDGLDKYDTKVTEGKNIKVTETKGAKGERVFNVATKDKVDFTEVKAGSTTINNSGIDNGMTTIKNVKSMLGNNKISDVVNNQELYNSAATLGDLTKLSLNDRSGDLKDVVTYRVQNRETKTGYTDVASVLKDISQQGIRGIHVNNERADAPDSSAGGVDSVAIGVGATVGKVGNGVQKNDPKYANSIAVGSSTVEAKTSIAVGTQNKVLSDKATAIGNNNTIGDDGSSDAKVAENSHVLGNDNKVKSKGVFVLGNNVIVDMGKDGAVVIGSDSNGNLTYKKVSSSSVTDANGKVLMTFEGYAGANSQIGDGAYVSVGAKNKERQIKHVAAGEVTKTSTDAINGSQLYATNEKLANLGDSVKESIGGETTIDKNGRIHTKNVGGMGVNTIDEAIALAAKKGSGDSKWVSMSEPGKNEVQNSPKTTKGNNSVAVGANSSDEGRKNVFSVGHKGGERTISNVADPIYNTDAVNLRTLNNRLGKVYDEMNNNRDEARAGIAGAAALGMLPQSTVPGMGMFGLSAGTYKGESASAIGVSGMSDNGRWVFKAGATFDTQRNSVIAGSIGFFF